MNCLSRTWVTAVPRQECQPPPPSSSLTLSPFFRLNSDHSRLKFPPEGIFPDTLQSEWDLVAQTCNPSYLEAKAGGLQVRGLKIKSKRDLGR